MMPLYYHVDRAYSIKREGRLAPGSVLALVTQPEQYPSTTENLQCLSAMFEGGLSSHGNQYLFSSSSNGFIEQSYELVRRAIYPHKPSRYQSLFAFDNLNSAREFAQKFGAKQTDDTCGPEIPIWSSQRQLEINMADS